VGKLSVCGSSVSPVLLSSIETERWVENVVVDDGGGGVGVEIAKSEDLDR